MLTRHIAIVPEVGMNASELARVSAALQKQVTRDLAPVWGISATVDPFPCLEDLPAGYWPLVLTFRELGIEAGIHVDEKGQPYALVEMSPSWSLTASHVCLEMLSDPFGNRMLAGTSPRDDQGQVEFLADICDPCGHPQYAYVVNDVLVSDFCTPSFWEPASRRERYSFTGAVQAPLEVLPGGHLRWYDPTTDTWWTRRILGDGPCDVNIGRADARKASPREFVDAHTPHHLSLTRMTADAFEARMGLSQQQALVAARSRAYHLRTTLGTSRSYAIGRAGELEGLGRGDRLRRPQMLGALLRASRGARENPSYEETILADDVEEVTTVDDPTTRESVAAAPPAPEPAAAPAPIAQAAVAEAPAPHRTIPPPLPTTPAPSPSMAPEQGALSSLPPPGHSSLPPSIPPVATRGRAAKPIVNSTVAIAAVAAAVVLGLALRDRASPQPGAAASPRSSEPTAETRPIAAPTAIATTPAAVSTPAPIAAPAPVAVPVQVATAAIASPTSETTPAAHPIAPRPKPAAAPAPVARAPRPAAQPQDSLDNLIDDRR